MTVVSGRPYVCARCLLTRASRPQYQRASSNQAQKLPYAQRALATVVHPVWDGKKDASKAGDAPSKDRPKISIRERLRAWEADNGRRAVRPLTTDDEWKGEVYNSLTLTQSSFNQLHDPESKADDSMLLLDDDALADIRGHASSVSVGDLMAIPTPGGRNTPLAIYLGFYSGLHYCYTTAGRWLAYPDIPATEFRVSNFFKHNQREALVDLLEAHIETNMLDELPAAPKEAEAMRREISLFLSEARSMYYENVTAFKNVAAMTSAKEKSQYRRLDEIADLVLPENLKKNGRYSPAALYCVHRALSREDHAFHDVKPREDSTVLQYEISSAADQQVIEKIHKLLYEYAEFMGLRASHKVDGLIQLNAMESFIQKARRAIKSSRKRREWSPSGLLGPEKGSSEEVMSWTTEDLEIIRFMEMFAAEDIFPANSTINASGHMILRLTDAYNDVPRLSKQVGFVFLQEIGWLAPWDVPARHKNRIPGTTPDREGHVAQPALSFQQSARPDVAAGARTDWGDLEVFCIDAKETTLIDDGVSLQRTDKAGEYWVHIHVADPTSEIRQDSELFKAAERQVADMYLPWNSAHMLPSEEVWSRFSLADGKNCLTLSALVNEAGDLLDYDVKPGKINKVVYTTPADVLQLSRPKSQVAFPQALEEQLEVGKRPLASDASPKLVLSFSDYSLQQRNDLEALGQVGACWARRSPTRDIGQVLSSLNPAVQVSFHDVAAAPARRTSTSSIAWHGEPHIMVQRRQREPCDLVEGLMVLAGHVAARWCNDRQIPIPYRSTVDAGLTDDQRMELARKIYDAVSEGADPKSPSLTRLYRALWGRTALSLEARPHASLRLDMYARATSPLRRFDDLLLHWQMHAALAEERRRGQSLRGREEASVDNTGTDVNKDIDGWLAFSRRRLGELLVGYLARARVHRQADRVAGPAQWIRAAMVRAWRFGEGPMPERLVLTIERDDNAAAAAMPLGAADGRAATIARPRVKGVLNWFSQRAFVDAGDVLDAGMTVDDVRPGDRFEVALEEMAVDVPFARVRILKKLDK